MHAFASSLLSASLVALAQPPFGLHALDWVALVPWLCVTAHESILRTRGLFQAGSSGLLLGSVYGLVVAYWIPEAFESQGIPTIHSTLGWVVKAIYATGFPFAALGLVVGLTRRASPRVAIVFVALFVFAMDALRLQWFWGIPWALLGHTQANVPGIAQLAVLGGVPGMSALVISVNLALALLARAVLTDLLTPPGRRAPLAQAISSHSKVSAATATAGALVAIMLGLAPFGVPIEESTRFFRGPGDLALEGAQRTLSVRALSHPVSAGERWVPAIQRTHLRVLGLQTRAAVAKAAAKAPGGRPDLIVWPENALTRALVPGEPLAEDLTALTRELSVPIAMGTVEGSPALGPVRSFATWVEPSGARPRTEKAVGVPVVETNSVGLLREIFGVDPEARSQETLDLGEALGGTTAEFTVTPLLCYEGIYPGLAAARRREDTRAIVHLTSDSWMRDPSAVASQLEAYSRYRAIEQRLPYIRVSDASGVTVIDAYSRELDRVGVHERGAVIAELRPGPPPTPLERVALVVLIFIAGGIGTTSMLILQRRCSWLFDPSWWQRFSPSAPSRPRPSRKSPIAS